MVEIFEVISDYILDAFPTLKKHCFYLNFLHKVSKIEGKIACCVLSESKIIHR
jgi:hypothetical protein